jgi:Fe-S-cluster containining protein
MKSMTINFPLIYAEFTGLIMDLCQECQGLCEKTQLSLFLPGELEYCASVLDMDPNEFKLRFCNIINFKGHDIYLLKLGVCPFLNEKFRCILEDKNIKPLVCRMYPVWIGLSKGRKKVMIDEKLCPKAKKIPKDFRKKAFKIYNRIKKDIPNWWLEFESVVDDALFDYNKLDILKNKPIILLEELTNCILKTNIPS